MIFSPKRFRLTSIEAAHESNLVIHNTQLLVVRPEEHDIIVRAVQGLQSISRQLGQAECAQRQVRERRLELGANLLARWGVIRVSEYLDVLVEGLQVVFGVL